MSRLIFRRAGLSQEKEVVRAAGLEPAQRFRA
jgi:hypothetical protein